MQAWRGWTATAAAPTAPTAHATRALTWAEWCAWQQRALHHEGRYHEGMQLTDRELARLSFVRWLYQTGGLGPRGNDSA